MVVSKHTVSPDSYRVDVVPGAEGNAYHVMRCEKVARFNSEEEAAFLVELLTQGQADGVEANHHG